MFNNLNSIFLLELINTRNYLGQTVKCLEIHHFLRWTNGVFEVRTSALHILCNVFIDRAKLTKKVVFLQNNLNYPLKIIKLNNRLLRVQLNLDLTIVFFISLNL